MRHPLAIVSLSLVAVAASAAVALAADLPVAATPAAAEGGETPLRMGKMTVFGKSGDQRRVAGSAYSVPRKELQQFEQDDVHRVVATAPGVYARDEDGYGLRPNIGMRGVSSERSAKISLLEDGVLLGPAAYSAPAAYYFPLMTRLDRVEILKGPATLRYGPNTVAGAMHLLTRPIPKRMETTWDLAGGNTQYGKLHLTHGGSSDHWGWLVEGVHLTTTGFKELDGGGDTGFDRSDIMTKLQWRSDPKQAVFHAWQLKLSYGREASNETYTGLTRADFARNPYRRYAATALDQMRWQHGSAVLSHSVDAGGRWRVETQAYHSFTSRVWQKLEGLDGGKTLGEVLANPTVGTNAVYYQLLSGQADSQGGAERLELTTNDRTFFAQGVQTRWTRDGVQWAGGRHDLYGSLRLHRDQADRDHRGRWYGMQAGRPVALAVPATVLRDAVGTTTALAGYLQDEATYGAWTVTAGVRGELAWAREADAQDPSRSLSGRWATVLPGLSVQWQAADDLFLFGGVHRGFIPVAPGQPANIEPERSWNVESGGRVRLGGVSAEATGFWSYYQNLKGTCTSSSGCTSDRVGDEFNGGQVQTFGVETRLATEPSFGDGWKVPLQLSYTWTDSQFLTSFRSDNPQWGTVRAGDRQPYLPAHQGAFKAGIERGGSYANILVRGTSAMQDVAGRPGDADVTLTDAMVLLDAAAGYSLGAWGTVYVTGRNLTNTAYVASARPFGLRPDLPLMVTLGWKGGW